MAYHRRAVDAKSAIAADSSEEGSSTVTLLNIGGHRSPQLSERLRRTSREGGGNSNGSSLDYQHDGKTQPLLDEVDEGPEQAVRRATVDEEDEEQGERCANERTNRGEHGRCLVAAFLAWERGRDAVVPFGTQ